MSEQYFLEDYMWYIPAIKVSLTDSQIMHRILDKRIPATVTFMMEGFVYFITSLRKWVAESLFKRSLNFSAWQVIKLSILSLPNSSLEAKFEDFLWTPSKTLQNLLCIFSKGRVSYVLSLMVKSLIQISEP